MLLNPRTALSVGSGQSGTHALGASHLSLRSSLHDEMMRFDVLPIYLKCKNFARSPLGFVDYINADRSDGSLISRPSFANVADFLIRATCTLLAHSLALHPFFSL